MPPRLPKSPLARRARKLTTDDAIPLARKSRKGILSTGTEAIDEKSAASATAEPTSSPRNRPRATKKLAAETTRTTPPNDWEIVYEKIKDFRNKPQNVAPVDCLGCERLADPKVQRKVIYKMTRGFFFVRDLSDTVVSKTRASL